MLLCLCLITVFFFSSFLCRATEVPLLWEGDRDKFAYDLSGGFALSAERMAGTARLFTPCDKSFGTSWEFFVQMKFTPSSNNNVRVYLCADTTEVGKLWGLCLRIGADKTISLWSEPASGNGKNLCKGIDNRLNVESVSLHVKASLDERGAFRLYSRLNDETDYTLEGTTTLSSIPADRFFGLLCTYSITRHQDGFYFSGFRISDLPSFPPSEPEPGEIAPSDVVINEVLYSPHSGGDEYVELYNRSEGAVDLSLLSIATRKTDGSLQRIKPLASETTELQSGQYALVTGTKENVCSFYSCCPDALYIELGVMTALADDGSTIVLFDNQSNAVIDEFSYTAKMHTTGVSNKRGVALERIDAQKPTGDSQNWSSASSQVSYGSPGCPNSSAFADIDSPESKYGISVKEPYSIPGLDNYQIRYSLPETGMRCNLLVFSMEGRVVDKLANNALLGQEGVFDWRPSPALTAGVYIIYMEVYDSAGKVEKYKLPVVLR